jgi:hypothetical protein
MGAIYTFMILRFYDKPSYPMFCMCVCVCEVFQRARAMNSWIFCACKTNPFCALAFYDENFFMPLLLHVRHSNCKRMSRPLLCVPASTTLNRYESEYVCFQLVEVHTFDFKELWGEWERIHLHSGWSLALLIRTIQECCCCSSIVKMCTHCH